MKRMEFSSLHLIQFPIYLFHKSELVPISFFMSSIAHDHFAIIIHDHFVKIRNHFKIFPTIIWPFLWRFWLFENRPLDPVLNLKSKCEANVWKSKGLKNCPERSKLITNFQLGSELGSELGSAWLSLAQLTNEIFHRA